tara:strand:- start:1405 stop:2148 length:744 start_codon:yes stop_codon:yes gene_type:complete
MIILGISGRKQAGKNTAANILHGIVLKDHDLINDWSIGPKGELIVETKDSSGWGEFDITRKDSHFIEYAEHSMWPFVKLYSFADAVKWMCTDLLDIPYECVWGTDDQKNQSQQHLLWENMPGVTTKSGPMTAREFMQFFGTDIMRKIYAPIWTNNTIKRINTEQSQLAIVADVRFPNEVEAINNAGGTVIRLTRKLGDDDKHSSEIALDDYPFTNYIDNSDGSIEELMVKVKNFYCNLKDSHASNLR